MEVRAAAEWRFIEVCHQAGGIRPLRCHNGVPGQRAGATNQNGARCKTRRRGRAARKESARRHRQDTKLHTWCWPHLSPTSSRHLLDRRSCPADLRSEELQSRCWCQREAGQRDWRRCGGDRRGKVQGQFEVLAVLEFLSS